MQVAKHIAIVGAGFSGIPIAARLGQLSKTFFTLGPPAKGAVWECTAVPEIRCQSQVLAKVMLEA